MNLINRLLEVPQNSTAIITSESKSITFNDLIGKSVANKNAPEVILICTDNIVEAVKCLIHMDGYAKSIFIASAWHDVRTIKNFALRIGVDLIITEKPESFADFECENSIENVDMSKFPVAKLKKTSWLLTTSGTTGIPKVVAHNLDSLSRSSRVNFKYSHITRWGLIYDFSRFAGMQVVLQSILSGATLVAPDFGLSTEEKISIFAKHETTHLSATPTMWRKILMTPNSSKLALRQITLGGEISDQSILSALEKKYDSARIVHIFASTEAGVGFSVSDKKAGFPLSYLESSPSGIELKIVNDLLHIKNVHVEKEYIFGEGTVSKNGWVNTGDRIKIMDDRIFFLGRDSGIINIGGDKIHPEEIENALLSLAGIVEAKVYAKPNPIMGSLVAADIVLKDQINDIKEEKKRILKSLSTKLDKNKIPAFIRFVDSQEVNVAGKLVRK